MLALMLALPAIACGTLATYLYDREAALGARLCAGVPTGFAATGLLCFVIASFIGLRPLALVLTAALTCVPLASLMKSEWRVCVRADIDETTRFVGRAISHPSWATTGTLVFYLLAATVLWHVFGRAMYVAGGEVFTGVDNNLGDLPFHISIINGFARGENFPPQHPEYAGVRLTYPFLIDFISAMFLRAGASLESSMFWPGFTLAVSLVGLLHRWSLKLTRDRVAALITPVLVLLSGGFGWWMLVGEADASGRGLFGLLAALPHDYTIGSNSGYRWGNALTTLLVPQRGLLLGLPLALVVWTLWWQATTDEAEESEWSKGKKENAGEGRRRSARATTERKKATQKPSRKRVDGAEAKDATPAAVQARPRASFRFPFPPVPLSRRNDFALMIGAGVVAGLMPLAHAHSYVVMLSMGGCLSLLFPQRWREWGAFFAVALAVAVPQMWWATSGSAVQAEKFFGLEYGWDRGEQNVVWFWLKNTGLFIPLLVAAFVWRPNDAPLVSKRLLVFFLPFTLCFFVPNVLKLSPWVWDNIKVLFYWYVAAVPLVAMLLARLWRGGVGLRAGAVGMLVVLTLAGALDVWRVASRASEQKIFDRDGEAFAALIVQRTPPRSLILHAPTYNHPVFLTGRRSLMGYAGHLWSQGIDYAAREREVQRMFAGGADADALLKQNKIEYVVVSPLEESMMPVSRAFFERYEKVGKVGVYSLYKTARQ